MPRARLTGCSCRSPLAHFYIHHAGSSIRELHPFTTITHLASENRIAPSQDDDFPVQFLFRKSSRAYSPAKESSMTVPLWRRIFRGKSQRLKSTQWTGRLAGLADERNAHRRTISPNASKLKVDDRSWNQGVDVAVRLEGPYFSPADTSRYDTVVCLVAGTGISGAVAIATAFTSQIFEQQEKSGEADMSAISLRWRRCILVWSVKETDDIELPFTRSNTEGLELRRFLTGPGRKRVDLDGELREIAKAGERTWVYISGPSAFIDAAKAACQATKRLVDLDFYAASWDV